MGRGRNSGREVQLRLSARFLLYNGNPEVNASRELSFRSLSMEGQHPMFLDGVFIGRFSEGNHQSQPDFG